MLRRNIHRKSRKSVEHSDLTHVSLYQAITERARIFESEQSLRYVKIPEMHTRSKISSRTVSQTDITDGSTESRDTHRMGLVRFANQSVSPSVRSEFMHVDLLLRREKRSQVALLVDMLEKGAGRFTEFLIAPIDPRVSRSGFGNAKKFGSSLIFPNLVERLSKKQSVLGECQDCGKGTEFEESALAFMCSGCEGMSEEFRESIHPGGTRHYWGPAVPWMSNVWYGSVEKLVHKRSRVGIMTAFVCQVFRDPSVRRAKLPSPDPRVQWCLYPLLVK
jgi:hypothetical protein